MVRLLTPQGQLSGCPAESASSFPENTVYLDLINPSKTEELAAESWLGYPLPTREEMHEIEESSRLYAEEGVLYMTAWVPVGLDTESPDNTPVSFILGEKCLATVRYSEPSSFRTLADHAKRQCTTPLTSDAVFLMLVELIVGRIADGLEFIEADLRRVSRGVFAVNPHKADANAERTLGDVVRLLGRRSALIADLRQCLVSLSRMMQFFLNNSAAWMSADLAPKFRTVVRDVKSLDEYTNQQTQEMTFLLDSTLGLISIQQNQIIKIFTVASVLFMPPTLIASIYGMNFEHMPELKSYVGYPVVLIVMIISAIGPIGFFKRKGLL
ncbi:MAG: Magnesium transporter [Verrucomicrobiaceae bacterium]|nr:Magnesium transporter [Verrucomicrobiaceae bacterium]